MTMKELLINQMRIRISGSRTELGKDAAEIFRKKLSDLLGKKQYVNVIFAAAPSQNEFLSALKDMPLAWNRIHAFHMDEYIGLDQDAPQGFGNFLRQRLWGDLPFHQVHYLQGNAADLPAECRRYADLLSNHPPDIACLGIGENGHLAFNDPHVADFTDPDTVKIVGLDELCRRQQVNDGCFQDIAQVPTQALTLTIPALMLAGFALVVVPGERKAQAIHHTLFSDVQNCYPSTVLRTHENAVLLLDEKSAMHLADLG
jgi:glucosamine-6-phosphate deaminase